MSRDVHSCTHFPAQLTSSPRIWTRITRALLVSKDRRHFFVTPLTLPLSQPSYLQAIYCIQMVDDDLYFLLLRSCIYSLNINKNLHFCSSHVIISRHWLFIHSMTQKIVVLVIYRTWNCTRTKCTVIMSL